MHGLGPELAHCDTMPGHVCMLGWPIRCAHILAEPYHLLSHACAHILMLSIRAGLGGAVAPHTGQVDHIVIHLSAGSKGQAQAPPEEQRTDAVPLPWALPNTSADGRTAPDHISRAGPSQSEAQLDQSFIDSRPDEGSTATASSLSAQQLASGRELVHGNSQNEFAHDGLCDETSNLELTAESHHMRAEPTASLPGQKSLGSISNGVETGAPQQHHSADTDPSCPADSNSSNMSRGPLEDGELSQGHPPEAHQDGVLEWIDSLLGALFSYPATAQHLLITLVLPMANSNSGMSNSCSILTQKSAHCANKMSTKQHDGITPAAQTPKGETAEPARLDWVQRLRPKQSFQVVGGSDVAVADLEPSRFIQCLPGVVR